MSATLWLWPDRARVGRVVPKAKFYEHAKVTSRLRDLFISDIERITWAYKLSPETVNLAATGDVPEIQVFVVDAKPGRAVSPKVLAAIDHAVQTPIVFEEHQDTRPSEHRSLGGADVRTRAAHKRPSPRGPVLNAILDGDWTPTDAERQPLPAAVNLETLYERLLTPLLPIVPRPGETLSDTLGRMEQASKLAREVETLERRMRAEPQLNRKLDIRRQLRVCVAQYDSLVSAKAQ